MGSVLLEAERLFPTRNDVPEPVRSQLIVLLNQLLADAVDLQTQAKAAHWNVKGPDFIALHKLFDEVYASVAEYVDLLAERAVQLGGVAEGTARIAARRSDLEEYPLGIAEGGRHAEALANALASFGARRSPGDRRGGRARRQGHGRPVHGGLPRHRQVALVRRGASPGISGPASSRPDFVPPAATAAVAGLRPIGRGPASPPGKGLRQRRRPGGLDRSRMMKTDLLKSPPAEFHECAWQATETWMRTSSRRLQLGNARESFSQRQTRGDGMTGPSRAGSLLC